MNLRIVWFLVIAVLTGLGFGLVPSGCATTPSATGGPGISRRSSALKDGPRWVTGSCKEQFKGAQVLCAKGSSKRETEAAMARAAAMGRGRSRLAKELEGRLGALLGELDPQKYGANRKELHQLARELTDISLAAVKLEDTWISPKGEMFTLLTMNRRAFLKALDRKSDLDGQIKEHLKTRSDELFR